MNKELDEFNMKKVILDTWKSKLSYPLNHNDIEELERIIDYYEEQIQELRNILDEIGLNPNEILYLRQENQKYKEVIDKAIDKLYCWGEALKPDFQKEMLDILKEVE